MSKAKVKHGAPASSSSSDNNGYVSGSGDGLSSSSDDAPTGNSDIDTLSKLQRKSLLLEQNGDTDPSGSSDDPEAPGAGTDTSDQAGGSKHGNAPPLVDREANIREMAGLMALNCYNMVAMAPTTSAKRRRTGELRVQKPKSSKYAAERCESLDDVAGARKRWFERVRDNLCAAHGSRECKKQRCTGCAFINLCTSHSGEDDWVEVTEWLLAIAAATGKAAHVIVNRGRRVQLMSISAGGEQMSTRELHADNWPDPTEELTVVWNGFNHFNGVVPEGWRKPEVEPRMGAGDASTVLGAWLREFRCQLGIDALRILWLDECSDEPAIPAAALKLNLCIIPSHAHHRCKQSAGGLLSAPGRGQARDHAGCHSATPALCRGCRAWCACARRLALRACPALVRTARSPPAAHATVGLGTSTMARAATCCTFSRENLSPRGQVSVEQGAFIGSVFLAVFSTALEARVYDRLAGKAARPECHRFVSLSPTSASVVLCPSVCVCARRSLLSSLLRSSIRDESVRGCAPSPRPFLSFTCPSIDSRLF
jgi:hypothetical protein